MKETLADGIMMKATQAYVAKRIRLVYRRNPSDFGPGPVCRQPSDNLGPTTPAIRPQAFLFIPPDRGRILPASRALCPPRRPAFAGREPWLRRQEPYRGRGGCGQDRQAPCDIPGRPPEPGARARASPLRSLAHLGYRRPAHRPHRDSGLPQGDQGAVHAIWRQARDRKIPRPRMVRCQARQAPGLRYLSR